jgi:type IV pilus assembly protein PilW
MKPFASIPSAARGAHRQRGFTLVEMMVAVAIGLVVALGFAVSFVNLKSTFKTQDTLSQLQDNERLAMAFLTSSVQQAGYFPDTVPPSLTKLTAIAGISDATYTNTVAGQFLLGTIAVGTTTPESLSTVYNSANGDGILTCQGATNTTGATITIRNVFYVDPTKQALGCQVTSNSGAATKPDSVFYPLVSNVASMSVFYAVDTDADGIADTYLTADKVGAHWNDVKAVRVTMNFINPNASLGGGQLATIPWTQTINLVNNR